MTEEPLNKLREALFDLAFSWADSIFDKGEYHLMDNKLSSLDATLLDEDGMIIWLTCSKWAKEHLKEREGFFEDCRNVLTNRSGRDYADKILKGLE
jgi:hypothetical protein